MTFHYVTEVEEVLPLALASGWKAGAPIDWNGGAKGARPRQRPFSRRRHVFARRVSDPPRGIAGRSASRYVFSVGGMPVPLLHRHAQAGDGFSVLACLREKRRRHATLQHMLNTYAPGRRTSGAGSFQKTS